MDLIPRAQKHFFYYLNFIKSNPNFKQLVKYIKISIYFSPFILLLSLIIIKRRKIQLTKETFKNLGFLSLIKQNKLKRNHTTYNLNNKNSNLKNFYNFQKKKISYNFPSGIHNYGTNCYINSLLQV